MARFMIVCLVLTVALAVACNEPSKHDIKEAERNAEIAFTALERAVSTAERDSNLSVIVVDLEAVAIHADSVIFWLRGGQDREPD